MKRKIKHIEVGYASLMRAKAKTVISGLVLSKKDKAVLNSAISSVEMPLYQYMKIPKNEIKQHVISAIIGGLGHKVSKDIKEEIEQCLIHKL